MDTKFQINYKKKQRFPVANLFKTIKKHYLLRSAVLLMLPWLASCNDYLDIVPDNVATMDNAFKLRNEAEKYLFTCYSFLPKDGDGWYNAGMMAGDEIWLPQSNDSHWHSAFRIALGQQNKDAPLFDEWAGLRKGGGNGWSHLKIWRGIRHCNIFLENVQDESKIPDLTLFERKRWISEAKFLKAFYHFYLFRMYGPIPLMKENAPIGEPEFKRMPVDSCVNYMADLLDQSVVNLPSKITDENTELGRITKSIAKAVKAKLLLYAASPLFNGNSDYANFRDKDGMALFTPDYDPTKWERARDAIKEAIDIAESNGHALYEYTNDVLDLSDEMKTQLNIRNAVTNRWSDEHVWALSNSQFINQNLCMPPLERGTQSDRFILQGVWAAPIKMAKMFYSENGVPIEEDKTLNFTDYTSIRTAEENERYLIEPGYQTARLNFDREPRFYADLGFDGGIWYMKDGNDTGADENTLYLKAKNSEGAGFGHFTNWNSTGYYIKKLVHWESTTNGNTNPSWVVYPWPEIRLADLYLMYAEALNEVDPGSTTAIEYLDKIRERAGLNGVVESWSNYSKNPNKFSTQDGLREIIHRERLIELAFEGHRFWDLRRWKKAVEYLNEDITGFNILGKTTSSFNNERVVFSQSFISPRDYFWPIGNYDTRRNPNLVENPGW
ncbi:RagB/SusD family nutrient uptake outer membrane protein [Echinicola jeungdonensis]|uniref:RagB/SusD family nutrient uptake outer membrane protein n=1 Tax=Echinicola jeungdonensis TaxID=709343 RepID=A0ABV5JB27_9BACT|nr:RagB/SusD family nutrient uptake outer membrane protein [Echinicola jeungdonensis]MDN3670429.1 RagB/SusD family nutrient uptake outer membrane protein [Echinicola jeungdonensis]